MSRDTERSTDLFDQRKMVVVQSRGCNDFRDSKRSGTDTIADVKATGFSPQCTIVGPGELLRRLQIL